MSEPSPGSVTNAQPLPRRRAELLTFIALAFGIWPIIAVGIVGGFGFAVWMWQIVFGPPGPPGH
ncbi:nitrate reductase NapE [Pararhizobium capsulatum DSM 1112]|uniref:Nitrate reductase NapE n=1 Tax=Pararhizobium capsulatum DSM 1112 TaxID=1121113 RepID=A0ABU0BZQ3_9HYPH|nr:periplasmic nitrate reductase, NapE protein [Pararhizobium capsulatum]MDQ0323743.1 nitrate reductase NapE [Pararhizobium capsulatum DSM 1112]